MPVVSSNFAAPIFPLTTIGFTSKWRFSDKATWILALYDGSPTDFDYNPYNLNWQFLSGDGLLAISEFQYSIKINELEGIYKAGLYSHNHIVESGLSNPTPGSHTTSLVGFAYAYQKLSKQNKSETSFELSYRDRLTKNIFL